MEKSPTIFDKFCDHLENITLKASMIICAVMLLVGWAHVIRRYVFNNALTWCEEFFRFSLVWFVLLSASIIHKRRGHIGVTIFRENMPKKLQRIFERLMPYLAVLATSLTAIYGIDLLIRVHGQLTPALQIPIWIPYAAVPLSFTMMTIY
jgi:TRAP-type C4-dicarboxylate transport system permease small subunit